MRNLIAPAPTSAITVTPAPTDYDHDDYTRQNGKASPDAAFSGARGHLFSHRFPPLHRDHGHAHIGFLVAMSVIVSDASVLSYVLAPVLDPSERLD